MAKNRLMKSGYYQSVTPDSPATPLSGDPIRVGAITGVAVTDHGGGGNVAGAVSADLGPAMWTLSVKGVDDNGNSAVAVGDALFYVDADTPKISKKSSGYFFGWAMATVGSGSTASIAVMHAPSPGAGTLGTGTVGATNLAASAVTTAKIAAAAVTAAKLTATLATGFIPLPLTSFRLIASNDIAAHGTPDGGVVSLDTDPTLKRVNGATDPQLRIAWAATSVIPIQAQFAYPPDLDDTAAVLVNLLIGKGTNTDTTEVLAVGYFEGVGDTNAGGNTAALNWTTAQKVAVTIAAGDVGPYPAVGTVVLTPGAHADDALYLYGAWIEYTRK